MPKKVDHTVFRNQDLFCTRCGGRFKLNYPIEIPKLNKKIQAFNVLHSDCEQTWTESEPDKTKTSFEERIQWWLEHGEVGASSKTMISVLYKPLAKEKISHPLDPADFRRCHKLINIVPEVKIVFPEISHLSSTWGNFINNWNKLTNMYLQNESEGWKNADKIGMYEFMQTLIVD